MDAFQTILVNFHTHCTGHHQSHLGWQYQYVYQPGFTVAVTNRIDELEQLDRQFQAQLNTLDDYNGYAPLHYAVKRNHAPAIASLLTCGADVDVQDAEGHSPLYLAVQDELPATTIELLQNHGAAPVDADISQRGELFGKVAATQAILDERHRELQQERDAKAAEAELKHNMKLLQRRGEQINEIGDKATQLNQNAAEYGDLARQLKEATKKKSKWLPF